MRLLLALFPLFAGSFAGIQAGYYCDGSIVMKKHDTDFSAGNFWCCQGDPSSAVFGDTGPTTCTAGTQIPLTQASKVAGGSGATSAPASASASASTAGGGSSSTSSGGAAAPLITNAPLLGAAMAAGGMLLAI